jgi:hypothetical protein
LATLEDKRVKTFLERVSFKDRKRPDFRGREKNTRINEINIKIKEEYKTIILMSPWRGFITDSLISIRKGKELVTQHLQSVSTRLQLQKKSDDTR